MALMAAAFFLSTSGQAAQYRLGTPFPIACEGVLTYEDGGYFLTHDETHLTKIPFQTRRGRVWAAIERVMDAFR
jgi:hypothetical protein